MNDSLAAITPVATVAAYGLAMPTVAEVHEALIRVFAYEGDDVWQRLCRVCGLDDRSPSADALPRSADALPRLLAVMATDPDPVIALCARSIRIRLAAFEHLAAAHAVIRRPLP